MDGSKLNLSREATYRWSLLAVGTGFSLFMIGWILRSSKPLFTMLLMRGVLLGFTVAISLFGFWLGRSTDDAGIVGRTTVWGLVGGGVLAGLAFWAVISSSLLGQQYPSPPRNILGGAVIGILTGSVAGYYHEQSKRRAEQLAKLRGQRLERLASWLSHDLRSPLDVAHGHLRKAQEERDGEDEHLAAIEQSFVRIQELIEDTMLLVKQGEEIDDTALIRLSSFADRCWQSVETGDAELVVESDVTFRANRNHAVRLFQNLFRNAVEHGSTNSQSLSADAVGHDSEEVTVVVGRLSDGFFVEDDGPGIPPDERPHVFELGYSGDSGGTGLGLALVNEIAVEHGWGVTVTEATAGGARFEITGVTIEERASTPRDENATVSGR